MVCRKLGLPRSGKICAVRVVRCKPLYSDPLYREVVESRKRLMGGLAEERSAHAVSARSPMDATILDRWRTVRSEVERAAGYYAIAIENYTEAVLSDLAHYLPAGTREIISGSADGRSAARANNRNGARARVPA